MGNQATRSAMGPVQSRDFDAAQLVEYENKMWREQSPDALSGFESLLNIGSWNQMVPEQASLSIEDSSIDSDANRHQEEAKMCWQAGFTNSQKMLETLKHGDFKSFVIPNNGAAKEFEKAMQVKVMILTSLFFVRHQGGTEAMDDFFTFAKKFIDAQSKSSQAYKCEVNSTLLVDETTLSSLVSANSRLVRETVLRLLHASNKIEPQKMFRTDVSSFTSDLKHMNLRRVLMYALEHGEESLKAPIVKLLFRWGMVRASAEDLMLASQLQQKYKVDISSELEFICKQSEVWKKPIAESGGKGFDRTEDGHVQSRVGHTTGSDRSHENDQACTDGNFYYIYCIERGFSKGTKKLKTGEWECKTQTEDKNLKEMTMLCHNGMLLVRHLGAPDVPFTQFSKDTLKPSEDPESFTLADGETEDYLKWTPLDTEYEENAQEGNRWHRASPMYSDGEFIYFLVQYRVKGFSTPIVKTVCEVYEVSEDNKMKRIQEVKLYKNENQDYYKGSKKQKDDGGHMARGSMACNGEILLWYSSHNLHVYDMNTGMRVKKEHTNSTSLITCYDAKEQWYYYMDAACYSWLKRHKVPGFKPKVVGEKVKKDLPELPIVFDEVKGEILNQIKEEENLGKPEDEEESKKWKTLKDEKKKTRNDLFELLMKQDEEQINHWLPAEQEELKRTTEPIANLHEVCESLILSTMGKGAQSVSYKAKALGEKKLLNEEMLPYFKFPFAVQCSKSNMILVRETLEKHLDQLSEGKVTTLKQSNAYNLIQIYQANIDCVTAIRIELKQFLPETELKAIHAMQYGKLEKIKLFEGQAAKADEDLTPEEIYQMHIVEVASKLALTLEENLDAESRIDKLTNLDKALRVAMENAESEEATICGRILPLMSTKKSLKDLFEGDNEELKIARKIINQCIIYLKEKISVTVANSLSTKTFLHREVGINKDIRTFMRAFCQELMVAFGNQLLTILEKDGVKKDGELTAEEQVQLKSFNDAVARKNVLEPMLYETYILLSQQFKELICDITNQVREAKVYNWEDKDQIKGFFDFINSLFNADKSIPRTALMFSLMMSAHKPQVTWLDEISEALKNCAEGLNSYLNMYNNLPYQTQIKLMPIDSYRKVVEESLRAICYSIGVLAYRLTLVPETDADDKEKLHKLNILQGGVEMRFIPALSNETKTQIEGSFKITNDKQLQQLALQNEDKVVVEASDSLLNGVIDNEKSQSKIEMTIDVLQKGLVTKQPFCPHANLGAEKGMKLTRAAFGAMLKFCDKIDDFLKLTESVDFTANDIGDSEQGAQKVASITKVLKDQASDVFFDLLKLWEQASQMRKWTSKVKLNMSERIKSEVEVQYRKELAEQNISKEDDVVGSLTDEQSAELQKRADAEFDKQLPLKYDEVISKAKFLIKLAVPQALREAKKNVSMQQSAGTGLAGNLPSGIELFRNRSTVNAPISDSNSAGSMGLHRSLTDERRGSIGSGDGTRMQKIGSGIKRRRTLLLNEGSISKADSELDWKDRMRQWKDRQQTDGAVNDFQDQIKKQKQSAVFSILGCLQATFKKESLQSRVEQSLVCGLRRSAGLNLLNYAMNLSFEPKRFLDLLQWFQGSLRCNRIQVTHYLTGLEGCGIKAENGIRQQFFHIIDRIVHVLKDPMISASGYTHLLNALCWNYTRDDHAYLIKLDIFKTIQCGDGTLMHPIFRSWGQTCSNFSIELERSAEFGLPSRLRQVFEFLVQSILESLFVNKEEEKLEIGGSESDQTMVSQTESHNKVHSSALLQTVCEILFANTNRYLRMKSLFPSDHFDQPEKPRFEPPQSEENEGFAVEKNCPKDLANYINEKGGPRMFKANQKLKQFMDQMKIQMFIQKIMDVGSSIDSDSDLSKQIREVAQKSFTGADKILDSATQLIVNRNYRAIAAIQGCSWEKLGLEQPELTLEEKSEVTGISVEEYKKMMAPPAEPEPAQAEDQPKEEAKEKPAEVAQPTQPITSWYCAACTFKNVPSASQCEMCSSPKEDPAAQASNSGQTWPCGACTLQNAATDQTCTMCGQSRPEPVAAAQPEKPSDSQPVQEESTAEPIPNEDSQPVQDIITTETIPNEEVKSEEVKAEEVKAEEAKEPTAAERQAEEERLIMEEKDPKTRFNRYLTFLLTVQAPDGSDKDKADDGQIEGSMYTEASLFRIIKLLDQMITISQVSDQGYQIVQNFSNPENLRHIIELAVEASTQNQILIQKILQQILKLDLPQEILDESVRLAKSQDSLKATPNQVYKLLLKESCLNLEKSAFLKLIFNRLEKSRKALYKAQQSEKPGLHSVVQESMRTIRLLYTDADKNVSLRKIVNQAFTDALMEIQDMNEDQIDAVMSLIPEASFQRIAVGTPCINKDGKAFNVVGMMHTAEANNKIHETQLFPNYSEKNQVLSLAGLYYDPEHPERQDLLTEKMIYTQPLLDLDEEQTATAAKLSIFMDPQALESLIDIVTQEESSLTDLKAKQSFSLLQTFIVRGMYNMMRIFKSEYTQFLQQFDLMSNFFTFLLSVANQSSGKADEQLVSTLLLELRADYLREMVMTTKTKSFGNDKDTSAAIEIFSSEDGAQFYAMRSERASNMFWFKTSLQFGANEGKLFSGALVDSDPANNHDAIFIVPSAKLQEPSEQTLQILKAAKVIITDAALNIDEFMKTLKSKIKSNVDRWRNCGQTRFSIITPEDFKRLTEIMKQKDVKNTDMFDRAYFLGMALKNISSDIWDKIEKETYRSKFANIGAEVSFEEVSTVWGMQILAELIEQKFSEDESGMQQIAIMETFEQIRSGVFVDQQDQEDKDAAEQDDPEKIELVKKNSVQFMEEVKAQEVLPDFSGILTATEKLSNDVAENFYSGDPPSKPDDDSYAESFKKSIFDESGTSAVNIKTTYHSCVKSLRQSYGRAILLNILSSSGGDLDKDCLAKISNTGAFKKVCDLMHSDYMTSSHVNFTHGNPLMLETSTQQITFMLKFMKDVPDFKSYFVKDFFKRGQLTLAKAAHEDFEKLDSFGRDKYRVVMQDQESLDPFNIIFFGQKIFELNLVEDGALPETIATFFDMCLGYSLVFKRSSDFYLNLELLKLVKKGLNLMDKNLAKFADKQAVLDKVYQNKLLQCLTIKLDLENCEKLNDRKKIIVEIIVDLKKLCDRYNQEFNKDCKLGFELSQSLSRALKTFAIIEEGTQFTNYLGKQKFKELLNSKVDSQKIKHLAQNYATDDCKYESKFKKTVTAEQNDLIIKIDGSTSKDIIQIKSDTSMLMADAGSVKSGRSLVMKVAKGTSATIEFPVRPQIVQQSGEWADNRFSNQKISNDTFVANSETAQYAAVQVVASHESVMFLGGDGGISGMGMRSQGRSAEETNLRRIEAPESMKDIKKITHGKFFRLVLTEQNKLYHMGEARRYMLGSDFNRDTNGTKFAEVENNFFKMAEGDKIVDICGGKCHMAVATSEGKIYGSGYTFYRHFSSCRHNEQNNEDHPFELKLPEGHKALNVWTAEKRYTLWVTATNEDGEHVTFGCGEENRGTGQDNTNKFEKLALPAGTYLTKISNHKDRVHGVDNQHQLWVWGQDETYGQGEANDKDELYAGDFDELRSQKKPILVKWFKHNSLQVLDVECGSSAAVVKCKDKDGNIVFYGLSTLQENLRAIGGQAGTKSMYKHLVVRLEVDAPRVMGFAMTRTGSYFIMKADNQATKSIDPDHPDATGLIHFYQQAEQDGKRTWKFLTEDQYEAQKDNLPDVCFATRHPINSLLERVVRERAGNATSEDLMNSDLPDLISAFGPLQFEQNAQTHSQPTTNEEARLDVAKPLYYSLYQTNGEDVKVFATEEEAKEGGQSWDMNPVVFYRIKKPVNDLSSLPKFELAKLFTQSTESNFMSFTIKKEQISQADIDAVEISDTKTLNKFKQALSFTAEQDLELIKKIDSQLGLKNSKISDCKASMFTIQKSELSEKSSLKDMDEKTIQLRHGMLFSYSKAFETATKFVNTEDRFTENCISNFHFKNKHMVIASVINTIVDKQLENISGGGTPEVYINRRKAFVFADEGNVDHEGKYTVFGQIITSLRNEVPDMSNFRHRGVDERAYKCKTKGEGAIDVGGVFRDSLVNIADELEDSVLPLLIKSPNNRNDHGSNRDCFIINPTSTSPSHLEMYKYLGAFIAFGILSKSPVPLNLSPTVWKQILGEKMTFADLDMIDAYSSQVLGDLRNHGTLLSDEDFEAGVDQTFTTVLSNGEEVELCKDGQAQRVTKTNIEEFIALVIKARFSEATEQIKAIQQGIDKVFMGNLGSICYLTPDAVEARACGAKEIDMDRLKSITVYSSCDENHELVQRFWRVFEAWTHEERGLYLKFIWGRNRLPVDLTKLENKHQFRFYENMSETGFPQAHTCFFQIDVPFYRTDELMNQRLMQAATLCGTVDTDNNNFAEE